VPLQDAFTRTWSSRILFWSISLVVIFVGIYLSNIRFLDAEWLSRAGCVVVMLGIWSGIGAIMQERLLGTRMRWQRRNARMKASARLVERGAGTDEIDKELRAIDDSFEKQHSDSSHELKLSLGMLEVSLLFIGTFLWGFGDLLVR